MTGYTPETWAAIRAADRKYTRTWLRAMAAFDAEPDSPEAMAAYNAIMGPANTAWRSECRSAVALSSGSAF